MAIVEITFTLSGEETLVTPCLRAFVESRGWQETVGVDDNGNLIFNPQSIPDKINEVVRDTIFGNTIHYMEQQGAFSLREQLQAQVQLFKQGIETKVEIK